MSSTTRPIDQTQFPSVTIDPALPQAKKGEGLLSTPIKDLLQAAPNPPTLASLRAVSSVGADTPQSVVQVAELHFPESASVSTRTSSRMIPKPVDPALLLERVERQMEGPRTYHIERPLVSIPQDLVATLTEEQLSALQSACLADYKESLDALEQTIPLAILETPAVIALLEKTSERLMSLLEAYVEIQAEDDLKQFGPLRVQPLELRMNALLANFYFDSEEKVKTYDGQVGSNPLAIRKVFREGNLRERTFLLVNVQKNLLEKLAATEGDPSRPSIVHRINEKLAEKGNPWRLNRNLCFKIDNVYTNQTKSLRTNRPANHPDIPKIRSKWPTVGESLQRGPQNPLPLSDREARLILEDCVVDESSRKRRYTGSGEVSFIPLQLEEDPSHPYLQAVDAAKMRAIAGPSGSADQIIFMIHGLGFPTLKDMYLSRLAVIPGIAISRSHSLCEILCASQAYGVPFTFGPSYYKELYPAEIEGSEEFYGALERHQARSGHLMPDACLSEEYVRAKAASRV